MMQTILQSPKGLGTLAGNTGAVANAAVDAGAGALGGTGVVLSAETTIATKAVNPINADTKRVVVSGFYNKSCATGTARLKRDATILVSEAGVAKKTLITEDTGFVAGVNTNYLITVDNCSPVTGGVGVAEMTDTHSVV